MTEKEKLNYLMNQGINVKQALKYADDSLDFYEQLIAIFLDEYEEKKKLVLKEAQNPGKSYTVLVHALKNNARYLGAEKLADLAYEHEKASKAEDRGFVKEHLEELLSTWERAVHIFKEM
ncbi:MAG: Hpt domain-containing protein [Suilimivivens sp.]